MMKSGMCKFCTNLLKKKNDESAITIAKNIDNQRT